MRSQKIYETGVLDSSSIFYMSQSQFTKEILYYIEHLGIFNCNQFYRVKRYYWDTFLLMFIKSGSMKVIYREQEFTAFPGDVVMIDCKELHEYSAPDLLSFYFFHFSGNYSQAYYDFLYDRHGFVFTPSNWQDLESTFKAILHQVRSPILDEHFVSALIHRMLSELSVSNQPGFTNPDDTIIEAINYINNNYSQNFTLADLASHLDISESHLSHSFKDYIGNTPRQYLIARRISHARHMLITTNATVDEVAEECGFQSSTHFIRTFKKHIGTTPHQFRKTPH